MRKNTAKRKEVIPDPVYGEKLVTKFVNSLMVDGKKRLAYRVFYNTINIVGEKAQEDGLEVWKRALNNVMPSVEVKSRRVGGATFQVPVEVRPNRKTALGIKWIIRYARLRGEKTMEEKLAGEILAASKGEGASIKKKDDTHRMAEANKAFSHFKL